MKIFSHDKATAKDELTLLVFVATCLILGVVGVILQPSVSLTVFGVLLLITGVMFIPSIIWRLHENYKLNK